MAKVRHHYANKKITKIEIAASRIERQSRYSINYESFAVRRERKLMWEWVRSRLRLRQVAIMQLGVHISG